jgi:methionyl-tRNA formyltransferase
VRIVYFGTSEFAVPALQALAPHVVLVVSQPDRPTGRGMKLQSSPVKKIALELGLPVETPEKARTPEFVELVAALDADVHVVAAYGQILSTRLLETAKNGGINLHGSILPCYRGAAPIQRSILNGDDETGVTLMQMDKGMDTGDMIDIAKTRIGPDETYGELQTRLSIIARDLVSAWIDRLAAGEYPRMPQESEFATYANKIDRTETELQTARSGLAEYDRYRAFTPSPSVFLQTLHGRLKIKDAKLSSLVGEPGKILALNPLTVSFSDASLEVHSVQPEGKPAMSGSDWANGQRLSVGDTIV